MVVDPSADFFRYFKSGKGAMSRLDVMMLALGWVLVIEGFTPMVAPGFWKESISRFLDEPDRALRITGPSARRTRTGDHLDRLIR